MASEPLDDITRRRLAIEGARAARREAKIAESIAKTEARRAAAASTCADPDALRASLQASIAASLGDCPVCRLPWGEHSATDLKSHVEQVFGVGDTNPSPPIGA